MSFFSARISIQWPPEEASEATTTMVMSGPSGKFVDLRPLKTSYTESEKQFPFEWAIIGESTALGEGNMQFSHDVDSRVVNEKLKCLKEGRKHEEVPDVPDIGHFTGLKSGDRQEDGEMFNVATGKIAPYIEIWRTLDGDLTTPESLQRISATKDNNEIKFKLFEISNDVFEGRYIEIGNWSQGILNRKQVNDPTSIESTLSCIRTYKDQLLVSYGPDVDQFPHTKPGSWTLLEYN